MGLGKKLVSNVVGSLHKEGIDSITVFTEKKGSSWTFDLHNSRLGQVSAVYTLLAQFSAMGFFLSAFE